MVAIPNSLRLRPMRSSFPVSDLPGKTDTRAYCPHSAAKHQPGKAIDEAYNACTAFFQGWKVDAKQRPRRVAIDPSMVPVDPVTSRIEPCWWWYRQISHHSRVDPLRRATNLPAATPASASAKNGTEKNITPTP